MHGICGADRDDMFVDMIPVHVVEMAVMKIVNMGVMANSRVPTVRAMLVGMVGMVRLGAGDHEIPLPLVCNLAFRGTSYRALHRLDYSGVRNGIEIEYVLVSGVKSGSGAYCR